MNRRELRKKRIAHQRAAKAQSRNATPTPPAPAVEHNHPTLSVTPPQTPDSPANASTGPRSEAGKSASSRNAVKHNLCSTRLTGADLEEFNSHYSVLEDEWKPATETECILLQQMALSQWRMARALDLELEVLGMADVDNARLALAIRYRTTAERAFYKALAELQRLRTSIRQDAERACREHEESIRRELDRLITAPFAREPHFVSQRPVSQKPPTPMDTPLSHTQTMFQTPPQEVLPHL